MADQFDNLHPSERELLKLAEAATPGPWSSVNCGTVQEPMYSVKAARIAGRPPGHEVAICATGDSSQAMEIANSDFIAASRTAIPDLLAEVSRLRGEVLGEREAHDKAMNALRAKDEAMGKLLAVCTQEQIERANGGPLP